MCGFNGVIGNLTEGKINEVKSNSSLIQHRGPDEHTNLYKKDTYIEFYRLSIVDIENGSQPQTDKDDNYTVFFNGEIYNFLHLKNELYLLSKWSIKNDLLTASTFVYIPQRVSLINRLV